MTPLRRRARNITRIVAIAAVPCAAGLAALPAEGRPTTQDTPTAETRSIRSSELLWATVNVCDTEAKPNTVGIRASMPGSGFRRERMFVRFQVQYLSMRDSKWHNLGADGDSGWVALGSGRFKARQAGRDFLMAQPEAGQTFRVRGAVTFEWRRGTKVVRRVRKRTEKGHPGTRGADPPSFSAASCVIS